MRQVQRVVLGVVAGAAAFAVQTARADNVTDLYFQEVIQRYFEYPQNARTFAMAGSSVQTSSDSSSVIGNPAGLGLMKDGEVSGTYSYNRISGDEFPTNAAVDQIENDGSAMFAIPLGPRRDSLPEYGNLGMAWTYRNGDWRDDSFDTETETTQVVVAYAYPINQTSSIGYSLGWTDDRFQSHEIFNYPMGNGFRHTLGATFKLPDMVVGASAMIGHGNHHALYGPGQEGDSRTLEYGADLGVEFKIADATSLAVGADYRHLTTDGEVVASIPANVVGGDETGNIFNARIGAEHSINNDLKLRGGYRFAGLARYKYNRVELNDLNGDAYYSAFTLGAGYHFPVSSDYIRSINLDYGVEYRLVGENDWQHVVSVSVPFNACSPS